MQEQLSGASPIPLYTQLKKLILEQIQSGELPGGAKLPSEPELCKIYNVSRNTVRSAIAELSEEGVLLRKQGKGTFVCHQKVAENLSSNLSFSSVCLANGMKPGNILLTLALQPATEKDVGELQVEPDSRVVFVERVLTGNDIPVIYDKVYLPGEYAPLLREDLEGVSLYETIFRVFGTRIARSHKTIELAYANDREAELLHVKKDSPVLLMNETVYDVDDKPVHRTKQIILGDRFKYEFN